MQPLKRNSSIWKFIQDKLNGKNKKQVSGDTETREARPRPRTQY